MLVHEYDISFSHKKATVSNVLIIDFSLESWKWINRMVEWSVWTAEKHKHAGYQYDKGVRKVHIEFKKYI